MHNAIQKAIEGGWICPVSLPFELHSAGWISNEDDEGDYPLQGIWLDPLFWQALGKAMGWNRKFAMASHGTTGETHTDGVSSFDFDGDSREDFSLSTEPTPEWNYRWHRFIDHLAQGKDPEEFFTELLKK